MAILITENFVLKAVKDALCHCLLKGHIVEREFLFTEGFDFWYGKDMPKIILTIRVSVSAIDPNLPAALTLSSDAMNTDEMFTLSEEVENILGNRVNITLD